MQVQVFEIDHLNHLDDNHSDGDNDGATIVGNAEAL
jgi:hypothetical protein